MYIWSRFGSKGKTYGMLTCTHWTDMFLLCVAPIGMCLGNISKCDYQESVTTGQTDTRRTKWSLCAAMLPRRHKGLFFKVLQRLGPSFTHWVRPYNLNISPLYIQSFIMSITSALIQYTTKVFIFDTRCDRWCKCDSPLVTSQTTQQLFNFYSGSSNSVPE